MDFKIGKSELVDGISFHHKGELVAYSKDGQLIKVYPNRCAHMGGKFLKHKDNCLRCPSHNWILNTETGQYENPIGVHAKSLVFHDQGSYYIVSSPGGDQKKFEENQPLSLSRLEFTVSYFNHASVKISTPSFSILTDPWLIGSAFCSGWWHLHGSPKGWETQVQKLDALYISHSHSDHFHIPSLKKIFSLNPNIKIYIPKFEVPLMVKTLQNLGFVNVLEIDFYERFEINKDTTLTMLPDESGREDSGLLIEYKGHRVLLGVDCANLCGGDLPKNVNVFLGSFAGGASGYPVCWSEMYSQQEIETMISKKLAKIKQKILVEVRESEAKCFIPYAGYFEESNPRDVFIKQTNKKNSPDEIKSFLEGASSNVKVHIPYTGDCLDVGYLEDAGVEVNVEPDRDFVGEDTLIPDVELPFEKVKDYFKEAKYEDDLVLIIEETSDDFNIVYREMNFDFRTQELTEQKLKENRLNQKIKMRVRRRIFTHVIQHKLPWEEITIGFHARFTREPDVYNLKFWDHFQNKYVG